MSLLPDDDEDDEDDDDSVLCVCGGLWFKSTSLPLSYLTLIAIFQAMYLLID